MLRVHSAYRQSMGNTAIFVALLAIGAALVMPFSVMSSTRGIAGYLPLHMLFETSAIVVSMLIFAVGWHAHNRNLPGNIVLLACAFFGVGMLDFAHMLSYAGMPDFITPSNPEKAIDFWLVARSLAAIALLAVAVMPWRPFVSAATRYALIAAVLGATMLAYWLILFHQGEMPHTFIPGQGLTAFKIAAEYAIIVINLVTASVLWIHMRKPLPFNVTALFGAVCVMALSEFFFTLYASVTDVFNLLGHVYKAIAYLLLYRAFFVATVEAPYRQLHLSKSTLRGTLDAIPDLVWLKDADGVYLECNAAVERFFGVAKANIVGKADYDFVDREQADFFREHDRKAMIASTPSINEEWLTFAEGGFRSLFETVKTPMHDDAGNLIGVLGIARDITERKASEQALRQAKLNAQEAEIRYRTVADFTYDWEAWIDNQGNWLYCSPSCMRITGHAADEFIVNPHLFLDILHPDDRDAVLAHLNETLQETTLPKILSFRIEHTDGRIVWIEQVSQEVFDGVGKHIGRRASNRDVTERLQAEKALNQFKQTLDQTLDSIFMFRDDDYRFIYVNQGAIKQVGYTHDELLEMTPLDIKPEYTLEHFQKMVQPLRDGTQPSLSFQTVHRHKDGHDIPVEIFLQLVRKERAAPRFMAIVRDITLRKSNEARIERLSSAYRLLSRVNEAIVRAQDRNELFAAICSAAIESELFRFVWIGLLDEKRSLVMPVAYAGVEEGYTGKLNIRLADEHTGNGPMGRAIRGTCHVVCQDIENDPTMVPWRDEAIKRGYSASGVFPIQEAGSVVGGINVYSSEAHFFTQDIIRLMLELAADVSFALDVFAEKKRREQAEEEIKRLNVELEHRVLERTRQLEAANKELEAFSYSVSHDLRAPLRSIDGFSRVLLDTYHDQLGEAGQDWLERVRNASQHMGYLIDDMLKLSQVSRSVLKRGRIDLGEVAKNVADDLRKTHPERQVRFIFPQCMIVHADSGLLRVVMDNLLSNAWKYTGKKTGAEIEFGEREINGENVYFVRDNGAGFNMDYVHKLFGPFQRLHGANEFEGTGIGLATVQRVIHRHHGKVWAEAIEGRGATFYFTLPQREPTTRGRNEQ